MDRTIRKKFEITTVTPLHIASGKGKLNKADYLYDKAKRRIHILNQGNWIDCIADKGKMDEYEEYISRSFGGQNPNANRVDTLGFAANMIPGFDPEKSDLVLRSFDFNFTFAAEGKESPCNDITEYVRDGFGKCYIPGGSLKGALRTNLIKTLLYKDKEKRKELQGELLSIERPRSDNNRDYNDYRRAIARIIDKWEFSLIFQKPYGHLSRNPNEAGFISVPDIYTADLPCETVMLQDYDIGLAEGRDGKYKEAKMPNVREYIVPGQTFYAEIGFDIGLMNELGNRTGFKSPQQLLAGIGMNTEQMFSDENSAFLDQGDRVWANSLDLQETEVDPSSLFILGANTGFHQKTVLWSCFDDYRDALDVTSGILHKKDRPAIFAHRNDKNFSPRIVNTIKWEGRDVLAGLVSLRIVE